MIRIMIMLTATASLLGCSTQFSGGTRRGKEPEPAASAPPKTADASPAPTPGISDGGDKDKAASDENGANDGPGISDGGGKSKIFTLGCNDPASKRNVEVELNADATVKVKGDFCPSSTGRLTVMLVVDFSGSMTANDPATAGKCGRSSAVQAILGKITTEMKTGDSVDVALVAFGSNVKQSKNPIPIADFSNQVGSGAISLCGAIDGTNYKVAMDAAKGILSAVTTGTKVMYFLSDGLPTLGAVPDDGEGITSTLVDQNAGAEAYASLKTTVTNFTGYFVFLDSAGAASAGKTYLVDALSEKDANKVKVASTASELATEIVKLSVPKVSIDESAVKAELKATGFDTKAVTFASFKKDATRSGIWVFETADFNPFNKAGADVKNDFRIIAQDTTSATTTYDSLLSFTFKIKK